MRPTSSSAEGHDLQEPIELAVQKATETAEENTNRAIQEAMDTAGDRLKDIIQRTTMNIEQKISDIRLYDAGSGDGNHRERKSNLISPKDTQPGNIQAKSSKAEFTHWRKCVELYVDAAT